MVLDADTAAAKLNELLPADAWVPEAELPHYTVQGRTPVVAVRPATEEEAVAVMRLAAADGWGIVPWGHGTAQGRGTVPTRYDLCFSTERLSAVLEHEPEDMVATVQAGASFAQVQSALTEQGQWWPLDPPDADATVGGIIATNRSGPRRALYGTARDHVLGMRMLHADGTVTKHGGKVVKNVAGYDLNKLHIGALGTLGIVLEVSVKVRPVPQHETVVAAAFSTFEAGAAALGEIVASELTPTAVELLNERAAQEIVPEVVGPAMAVLGFEGAPTAVERQVSQASKALETASGGSVRVYDRDAVPRLWRAFRDLGADGPSTAVLWCTLAAPPVHVGDLAARVQATADDHSQRLLLDARAANGVLRLGLIGQPESLLAERVVNSWREHATTCGGTLVVDEAPNTVRDRLDVWGPPRQDFFLMQRFKHALDPRNLLNTGRYVGGI